MDAAEEALTAGLAALPGDAALEKAKLSLQKTRAKGGGEGGGGGGGGEEL